MPEPFRGRESLADHIHDLANAFASVAGVLSQQYKDLNKATNGLLDDTYPWKGQASVAFFNAWQSFGKYMQAMQKSCEDTSNALNKYANQLSDIETQQGWDVLLTIAGGLLTIVSFAAMIGELGLNPFVDGFTAFIGTFTEQEGADVVNVSGEITQADTEAASELQQVENDMTSSPVLTGSVPETPGSLPDAISPASLDELTLQASIGDDMTPGDWAQWVEDNEGKYTPPPGSLNGIGGSQYPNACGPSAVKMLLTSNGITNYSDQEITTGVGYTSENGTTLSGMANGMKQMGLNDAAYDPNMSLSELRTMANGGKPVLVGINLTTDPNLPPSPHTVVVDGIESTPLGNVVEIRDPLWNPPRAYTIPLKDFAQVWQFGGITY